MFGPDRFIEDCRAAVQADPTHRAVLEVVERAFDDPAAVLAVVGEPVASGLVPLYRSPDLTIINVVWKPGMAIMPHNHDMWAVIGIYGGREDNYGGDFFATERSEWDPELLTERPFDQSMLSARFED
ncbi:MAG: hypothetical protein ABI471_02000 [Sphingomonas bacterium]